MHIYIDFIDKNNKIGLPLLYTQDIERVRQWYFISANIPELSLGNYQYNKSKDIVVSLLSKATPNLSKNGHVYKIAKHGFKKGISKKNKKDFFLITACKVDNQIEEIRFLKQFDTALTYITNQEGFVRFWLLQNLSKEGPYRYINIAQWKNLDYFMSTFNNKKFQEKLDSELSMRNQITISKLKF